MVKMALPPINPSPIGTCCVHQHQQRVVSLWPQLPKTACGVEQFVDDVHPKVLGCFWGWHNEATLSGKSEFQRSMFIKQHLGQLFFSPSVMA